MLATSGYAIDLKQVKFTQVVNTVEIISGADQSIKQASVNDPFKMPDTLRTGPSSRAEMVAADNTITRVGANTVFTFDPANRTIDLDQGSLLFHSPHGKGGGTIHSKAATASVIGTTIIVTCTPNGGFKLLDLEGEAEVRFANGLKQRLEPGQMTFILPGGQISPIIIFRLDSQAKESLLVSGFSTPLPSIDRIDAEITRQLLALLNNQLLDVGLLVGDYATINKVQVFEEINSQSKTTPTQPGHTNPGSGHNNTGSGGGNNSGGGGNNNSGGGSGGDSDWSSGGSILISENPISITPPNDLFFDGQISIEGLSDVTIQNTSVYSHQDIYIQSTSGDIQFDTSDIAADQSLTLKALSGAVILNTGSLTAGQDVTISAETGITINGADITADSSVGTISLDNASGITTIKTGFSLNANYISVNSPDGILITANSGTLTGNQLDLTSGNLAGTDEIDIKDANLTAFSTINMSAHTINLFNVSFASGSMVYLHSFLGLLAPSPNTNPQWQPGQSTYPGYVNFIYGVTYGGDPAQNHVNPVSGPGIYISK